MSVPVHIADQVLAEIRTRLAAIVADSSNYNYTPARVVRRIGDPMDPDFDESVGAKVYIVSALDRGTRPRTSTMSATGTVPFVLTLISQWNWPKDSYNQPTPDEVRVIHNMERDVEKALYGDADAMTLGGLVHTLVLGEWNRGLVQEEKEGWLVTRAAGEAEYKYYTGNP